MFVDVVDTELGWQHMTDAAQGQKKLPPQTAKIDSQPVRPVLPFCVWRGTVFIHVSLFCIHPCFIILYSSMFIILYSSMFHYFVFIHVSLFCIHPFDVIILFFLMLCGKGRDAVHGDDAVYVLRPKAAGSLCQRWCQRSTVAISRCARAGTCVPTSITSR